MKRERPRLTRSLISLSNALFESHRRRRIGLLRKKLNDYCEEFPVDGGRFGLSRDADIWIEGFVEDEIRRELKYRRALKRSR